MVSIVGLNERSLIAVCTEKDMAKDIGDLTRNWSALVLRGTLAIGFGLTAFLLPRMTLTALVILFAGYAFVDGVFSLVAATRAQHGRPWWALLILGVAGILTAVITLFWPGLTALSLVFVIAGWAIASGVLEIVAAIRLRRSIEGEWLLGLTGVISILFGMMLAIWPGTGALALIYTLAAYAIVLGGLLVALGLKLRHDRKRGVPRQILGQPA